MKSTEKAELIVTLNAGDPIPPDVSLALPVAPFAPGYDREFNADFCKNLAEEMKANGRKVYAVLTGFIMEEELEPLRRTVEKLKKCDGIYFGDEAVMMVAKTCGYTGIMIYQPDTLVCSSADVRALQEMGIDVVSLAHELSLEEVISIAEKSGDIEVQIQGEYPVLISRRHLLDAYGEETGNPGIKDGIYDLRESTRNSLIPILQNPRGTVLFSPESVSSIKQLPQLVRSGIRRFRIESRFMEPDLRDLAIRVYRDIIDGKTAEMTERLPGSDNIWLHHSVKTKGELQ